MVELEVVGMIHLLRYRAASFGFAHLGVPDNSEPHWYCTCGGWRVNRDLQGRPFEEAAQRRHWKHLREASAEEN